MPPIELAPQSRTVVGCCAVSCFDLPSYLFYAVFLLGICEFFLVLCYLLDICALVCCLLFSAVFVYLISMYNKVLLDIYVRSILYAYT